MVMDIPRDIDALEEAFIRAHALERREPGGRRWPFAGDAPWHLMERDARAGDADARGGVDGDDARSGSAPRSPLDAAEVDELATLRAWLAMVPDAVASAASAARFGALAPEHDRKLVWLATGRLHAGEGRVPWTAIRGWLGSPRSPEKLVVRYRMALAAVVCALNGWPFHRAKRMAA